MCVLFELEIIYEFAEVQLNLEFVEPNRYFKTHTVRTSIAYGLRLIMKFGTITQAITRRIMSYFVPVPSR